MVNSGAAACADAFLWKEANDGEISMIYWKV